MVQVAGVENARCKKGYILSLFQDITFSFLSLHSNVFTIISTVPGAPFSFNHAISPIPLDREP